MATFDGITDDTLLLTARFLPTAKDLLCLGLTCPRPNAKIMPAQGAACGGGGGASRRGSTE